MRLGLFDFKRKRDRHPEKSPDAVSVDAREEPQVVVDESENAPLTGEDLTDLWDALAEEIDELSLDELEDQLTEAPEIAAELQEWAEAEDEEALKALVDAYTGDSRAAETAHGNTAQGSADSDAHSQEPIGASNAAEDEDEYGTSHDFDANAAAAFQDESVEELPGADDFYAAADAEFDPESFDENAFLATLQALEQGSAAGEPAPGPTGVSSDVPVEQPNNAMLAAADLLNDLMEEDSGGPRDEPTETERTLVKDSMELAGDILRNFHEEEPDATPQEGPVPDAPSQPDAATSGVVSDEIVLALMHAGVIRVAQVYDASRHRRPGEPLWRAMLEVEEVDRGVLLAEVARQSGYEAYEDREDLPVKNLVENMRETVTPEALDAVLDAGAIPVEIGLNPETLDYRLILATDDPVSRRVAAAAAALPVETELRYMPTTAIDAYLDEVHPDRLPRTHREPEVQEAPDDGSPRSDRGPAASASAEERARNRPWPKKGDTQGEQAAPAEPVAAPPAEPVVPVEKPGVEQDISLLDRRAKKDRVVAALFKEGSISIEQVEKALTKYGQEGGKEAIWRILAAVPGVDRERVFSMAAKVYAFPRVELGEGRPDHEFVMLIMETIAEERREDLLRLNLLPFEYAIDAETGGARLMFVTHDPARSDVHRLLAQLKVGRFELRYASEAELTRVITEIFPKRNEYLDRMTASDEPAFDFGADFEADESELVDETALEAEMSRSVLINLFEASLIEAVRQGASDIHVFPNPKRHIEIHFRVDGRLRRWHVDEKVAAEAFLAVVKDNSTNVDRFEREMAQDGFIQRRIDDVLIRFRVSVLPIASANQEIRAESVVIRVLDDRKVLTDLSKLGMLPSALESVNHAISQPHGMVILTGPTGSGKSTTLVAALHQVISPEVNVLTIEDPVEYIINGVRQIKLSHKLGLEDAIRAVLRHDPDIVMVGEMRDKATADLAIKLANTGHLTFSTLHTNDAPSAVSRLYKMGVEPFLLAYAINLVVAQRLIRKLCPVCKRPAAKKDSVMMKRLGFTDDEIENLEIMEPAREKACPKCSGAGYKGRRAISETLYFSQEIRHLVAESGEDIDEEAIMKQAQKEGMLSLQDCARQLVKDGETSIEEMMRVTASE
ncbi:MAG: type II/IV secretion system protein [Rhodothermales bacterium]|nr:type II/IV secretion system protein [Rhodothermales bacterium]MBO6780728.1 type II/IV secretion system protein [Rhodothermales bacterium]